MLLNPNIVGYSFNGKISAKIPLNSQKSVERVVLEKVRFFKNLIYFSVKCCTIVRHIHIQINRHTRQNIHPNIQTFTRHFATHN